MTFAKQLAGLADVFVQDGFGVVHRAHASTEGVTHYLPSVAGLLLEKEVDTITKVMKKPERPLMAIIGGAKIADKIDILQRFIEIADFVAIGGAMANTFLVARGVDVAESCTTKTECRSPKTSWRKAAGRVQKAPVYLCHAAATAWWPTRSTSQRRPGSSTGAPMSSPTLKIIRRRAPASSHQVARPRNDPRHRAVQRCLYRRRHTAGQHRGLERHHGRHRDRGLQGPVGPYCPRH